MNNRSDTIYAFATAAGTAGVAVLRISGADALSVARIFGAPALTPRLATLARVTHPATLEMIDHALWLYFEAPHSFTGEHVVEIHLHGSRAVRDAMLAALSEISGLRMAEAGEFARRAYANGKMDLTALEGLSDLLAAETSAQLTQATRQMRGSHATIFNTMRADVLRNLALLEAYIDFPDEEIPEEVLGAVANAVTALRGNIGTLLSKPPIGERIREGIDIVLTGAPNAGKSSLLNALAGRDIAIVHESAGTTRDMVEVQLQLGGYPVTLVDTAGLRDAEHAVEAEGIKRAIKRAEQAECVVAIHDITNPESINIKNDDRVIHVFTKADLLPPNMRPQHSLMISTKTGENMEVFIRTLTERVGTLMAHHESPVITRARHRRHLETAHQALSRFDLDSPLEIACEELRHCAAHIGNITGKIAVDDVFDVIFKEFCIGK